MLRPKYVKPRGRIDKSVLMFGEPARVRDRAWLDTANGATCWNCGVADGTVVKAHIRWDSKSGMGLKPSDDETADLCGRCHASQESQPGPEWWAHCLKNMAKRIYRIARGLL